MLAAIAAAVSLAVASSGGVAVPKVPKKPNRIKLLLDRMRRAGNRIARRPYVWGGGHGSFSDYGYDCSGSVSYVLHSGGLLSAPEASGELETFGRPGPGKHVTIFANAGHVWMTIDRRRFDTIALAETGSRWTWAAGDATGYEIRHPAGL